MAEAPWDGPTVVVDNTFAFEAWRAELFYKADTTTLEPKRFSNFRVLLTNHGATKGGIALNDFTGGIEIGQVPWNRNAPLRKLTDLDAAYAREWLQNLGMQPTKDEARDAVDAAARANRHHPIREYLAGLHWDGVPRIDAWLSDYLGVADTPFVRAIAPMVLISAVARIMQPGCKVDNMLVLEGGQNAGKSSAIAALFGREYTLEAFSLFGDQKRMVMSMSGKWGVEIAEFAALQGVEGRKAKGMISAQVDTVALNYARVATDHPRQSIFIATVNPEDDGYLSDPTGNRRYWPVTVCDQIDPTNITAARDQLWAEALTNYRAGDPWWLTREQERALARPEQASREETHPWDDLLARRLVENEISEISSTEALSLIGVPNHMLGRPNQMIISTSLRRAGFTKGKSRDGTRRLWRRNVAPARPRPFGVEAAQAPPDEAPWPEPPL